MELMMNVVGATTVINVGHGQELSTGGQVIKQKMIDG